MSSYFHKTCGSWLGLPRRHRNRPNELVGQAGNVRIENDLSSGLSGFRHYSANQRRSFKRFVERIRRYALSDHIFDAELHADARSPPVRGRVRRSCAIGDAIACISAPSADARAADEPT